MSSFVTVKPFQTLAFVVSSVFLLNACTATSNGPTSNAYQTINYSTEQVRQEKIRLPISKTFEYSKAEELARFKSLFTVQQEYHKEELSHNELMKIKGQSLELFKGLPESIEKTSKIAGAEQLAEAIEKALYEKVKNNAESYFSYEKTFRFGDVKVGYVKPKVALNLSSEVMHVNVNIEQHWVWSESKRDSNSRGYVNIHFTIAPTIDSEYAILDVILKKVSMKNPTDFIGNIATNSFRPEKFMNDLRSMDVTTMLKTVSPSHKLAQHTKQSIRELLAKKSSSTLLAELEKKKKLKMKQKQTIDILNQQGAMLWELAQNNRFLDRAIKKGDSVCDYANKMGFVEELGEKRAKVMWIKQVVNEPSGFWFGNMGLHIIMPDTEDTLQYNVRELNKVTWVRLNKFGSCSFD